MFLGLDIGNLVKENEILSENLSKCVVSVDILYASLFIFLETIHLVRNLQFDVLIFQKYRCVVPSP